VPAAEPRKGTRTLAKGKAASAKSPPARAKRVGKKKPAAKESRCGEIAQRALGGSEKARDKKSVNFVRASGKRYAPAEAVLDERADPG
jgi:hypothetical protein